MNGTNEKLRTTVASRTRKVFARFTGLRLDPTPYRDANSDNARCGSKPNERSPPASQQSACGVTLGTLFTCQHLRAEHPIQSGSEERRRTHATAARLVAASRSTQSFADP